MARRDDRIAEEIAFHIEQQTAKHIAAGMSPEDALPRGPPEVRRRRAGARGDARRAARRLAARLRPRSADRLPLPGPRAVVLGDRDPHDRPRHRRRRRDVHASSTACCCGRCRTPTPTASCSCSRSATRAGAAPTSRSPTSSTGRRRRAASRRWPRPRSSRRPSPAPASRSRCGWRWSRRTSSTSWARGRRAAAASCPRSCSAAPRPVALVGARFWERWQGRSAAVPANRSSSAAWPHAVVGVMPPGLRLPAAGGDLDAARAGLRVAVAHRAQLPRRRRGSSPASTSRGLRRAEPRLARAEGPLRQRDDGWPTPSPCPSSTCCPPASGRRCGCCFAASLLLLLVACTNVSNLLVARAVVAAARVRGAARASVPRPGGSRASGWPRRWRSPAAAR